MSFFRIAAALLLAWATSGLPADAGAALRPFAGVGGAFGLPASDALREIYPSTWGLSAAVGLAHESWGRIEIRVDRFAREGLPSVPPFGLAAESRITLVPVSLGVQWHLRRAPSRPFVAAGPIVWFTRESFTYPLIDGGAEIEGDRTDWGGFLGLGWEFEGRPLTYRITARLLFGSGEREILRPRGHPIERDDSRAPSMGSVGLEILFP